MLPKEKTTRLSDGISVDDPAVLLFGLIFDVDFALEYRKTAAGNNPDVYDDLPLYRSAEYPAVCYYE